MWVFDDFSFTAIDGVTSFGFSIGDGEQSDWLVSKAQVHQCRVDHKHNKNRG